MQQETIAIFGATSPGGTLITTGLAGGKHKLLLSAGETLADAQWMAIDLQKQFPGVDVEAVACDLDAAWEADIIIVAVPDKDLAHVFEKIKDVASCKIVIYVTDAATEKVSALCATLLPYSKHVNVITEWSGKKSAVFVQSNNEEALTRVVGLLDEAGITPVTIADNDRQLERA